MFQASGFAGGVMTYLIRKEIIDFLGMPLSTAKDDSKIYTSYLAFICPMSPPQAWHLSKLINFS